MAPGRTALTMLIACSAVTAAPVASISMLATVPARPSPFAVNNQASSSEQFLHQNWLNDCHRAKESIVGRCPSRIGSPTHVSPWVGATVGSCGIFSPRIPTAQSARSGAYRPKCGLRSNRRPCLAPICRSSQHLGAFRSQCDADRSAMQADMQFSDLKWMRVTGTDHRRPPESDGPISVHVDLLPSAP